MMMREDDTVRHFPAEGIQARVSVSRRNQDALIVGAGVAGLACAVTLSRAGFQPLVLEADVEVGGRVRTDRHPEGFLLDHGFQVLLTGYPTLREVADLEALELRRFYPGAMVRVGGGFLRLSDPLRRPLAALETAVAPLGNVREKWQIVKLALSARRGSVDELFVAPELPTDQFLKQAGIGAQLRHHFLYPFLRGVTLDPALQTSSRFFSFVWRMFSSGAVAVPAYGIGELPRQLASRLPAGAVRLGTRVRDVAADHVITDSGERFDADAVVVATEGDAAARWLPGVPTPSWHGVTTISFAAEEPPVRGPYLILNGEAGGGVVNQVAVMSEVSPRYAPAGLALITASVVGLPSIDDDALVAKVQDELTSWFGQGVRSWRLLDVRRIEKALPRFAPPTPQTPALPARLASGVYVCGDHRATPSLEGALRSGVEAARAVIAQRRQPSGAATLPERPSRGV